MCYGSVRAGYGRVQFVLGAPCAANSPDLARIRKSIGRRVFSRVRDVRSHNTNDGMEIAVLDLIMFPLDRTLDGPAGRRTMPIGSGSALSVAAYALVAALALCASGAGAAATAEADDALGTVTAAPSGEPDSPADAPPAAGAQGSNPDSTGAPAQAKDVAPVRHAENSAAAPEIQPEAPASVKPAGAPASAKPAGAPAATSAAKPAEMQAKPAKTPTHASAAKSRPKTAEAPSAQEGAGAGRVTVPESERVGRELDRTDRGIARARRSVAISKNTQAQKLLSSGLDFQSDARGACKVHQYARAERLTLVARDYADRAARMVGPPREDPDYVEHVLQRTDDALDRAKDVLKNGAGQDARNRHEDLKRSQKEAWKTLKAGDVGQAYKQTLAVREGVLDLLGKLSDLPVPREAAEKAISGAQVALEQATKELGPRPSGEAARLVRLANSYLDKARDSFNKKSYRSALLQAKVVERHLERAVDVGRPRG